jgi:hypothetical protein
LGGELSITTNITNIERDLSDRYSVRGNERFRGLAGGTTRLTSELEWKRQFVVPGGLVLTPLLAARGDIHRLNMNDPGLAYAGIYEDDDSATRSMLTAGLEARYPILATTDTSTHLFEPIAQIYFRPDEGPRRRIAERRCAELRVPTRPTCSSATSSPATTASRAARAPISACVTPAPSTMACACARSSANPSISAASIPSRRPIS